MSEIGIGNCSCLNLLGDNIYGKYCYREEKIYLGKRCNEKWIFAILNHEFLHCLIEKILNKEAGKDFDWLWYDKKFGFIIFNDTDDLGLPKCKNLLREKLLKRWGE